MANVWPPGDPGVRKRVSWDDTVAAAWVVLTGPLEGPLGLVLDGGFCFGELAVVVVSSAQDDRGDRGRE